MIHTVGGEFKNVGVEGRPQTRVIVRFAISLSGWACLTCARLVGLSRGCFEGGRTGDVRKGLL